MTRLSQRTKGLLGASALTLLATPAFAMPNNFTPAGTVVENTFELSYTTGTVTRTFTPTDTTDFTVDRLINVNVDGSTTTGVAPGSEDQQIVYTVTNNGNDDQGYLLAIEQETTDNFDGEAPATDPLIQYYLDDGDGICDEASPTLLTYSGSSVPTAGLAPDAVMCVVVSQDIPTGAADGEQADISLIASTTPVGSNTESTDGVANTIAGVENVLADVAGTFTGDAAADGDHSAVGSFTIGAADVTGTKEVFIVDTDGTGCSTTPTAALTTVATTEYFVPGACVQYVITVTNSGSQDATAVSIDDILPREVDYSSHAALSFTGTAPTVTVQSGDDQTCNGLPAASTCDSVALSAGTVPAASGGTDGEGVLIINALVR